MDTEQKLSMSLLFRQLEARIEAAVQPPNVDTWETGVDQWGVGIICSGRRTPSAPSVPGCLDAVSAGRRPVSISGEPAIGGGTFGH